MNDIQSFTELSLPISLARALEKMNFTTPTPVQAASILPALEGKDILATAQTGTGKTAAFGVPLLANLIADPKKQALILAPTRELAAQIHTVLKQMSVGSELLGSLVVGGESFGRQADELRRGVDFMVATPGRLNDHLQERTLSLKHVGILVLDEVDRMLDMGFAPQIRQVMSHLPQARQTLLFSATLPPDVKKLTDALLHDPVRVAIGSVSLPVPQVTEETVRTTNEGKNSVVLREVEARQGRILVFVRTKSRTSRLARMLDEEGHDVVCLHGGRTQAQRKEALSRFKRGSHRIMVATDLAGRGIDVADIEHVINYDLPSTREDYIHRIGRTGRAGKTGNALNLVISGDFVGEQIISGAKASNNRRVFKPNRFARRSRY